MFSLKGSFSLLLSLWRLHHLVEGATLSIGAMLILNPNWEIFTALKNAVLALIISFSVLVRAWPASYYPKCKPNHCGIRRFLSYSTDAHFIHFQNILDPGLRSSQICIKFIMDGKLIVTWVKISAHESRIMSWFSESEFWRLHEKYGQCIVGFRLSEERWGVERWNCPLRPQ